MLPSWDSNFEITSPEVRKSSLALSMACVSSHRNHFPMRCHLLQRIEMKNGHSRNVRCWENIWLFDSWRHISVPPTIRTSHWLVLSTGNCVIDHVRCRGPPSFNNGGARFPRPNAISLLKTDPNFNSEYHWSWGKHEGLLSGAHGALCHFYGGRLR